MMLHMIVCLPALAAVLAIGLWVWVDHVRYGRDNAETPLVIDHEGRLMVGQVWCQGTARPVEPSTAVLPILHLDHAGRHRS